MDNQNHRRSLYKEHKHALTPSHHSRLNRQLQEANRNKRRKDIFQSARNISPSPTPNKASKDKENHVSRHEADMPMEVKATPEKSRTAKVICTARDPEKIKKQEAFILRYLDWKDKKKAMQEKEKRDGHKKRPFVSAVGKDSGFGGKIALASKGVASHHTPSFVPKGQNEFKPPPGLKYPEEVIKDKIKSRQSIYTIVPTPPKKPKSTGDFPITRKALPSNVHCNQNLKKTPAHDMANNKHSKPVVSSSGAKTKSSAVAGTSGTKAATTSAIKPSTIKPRSNLVKAFNKVSSAEENNPAATATTTHTGSTTTTSALKPRHLKMPPPAAVPPPLSHRIKKSEKAPQKTTSYGGKSKIAAANKRLESNKTSNARKNGRNSPQQPQKNARLTQTMKAKKPAKPLSGPTSTKFVSLMLNQADNRPGDIQTPGDFSNSNHFEEFVTSTKVKNSNHILEEVNGVSPIEPTSKRSSTSAKRNLLKEATMNTTQTHLDKDKSEVVDDKPQITGGGSRFNFIRYSEINTTTNAKPPSGPTSTKLVSLMVNQADNQPGDIQTPLDFSNSNHFEEFVTSTKLRDSNYILEEVNGVRPIETTSKRSSTSAKRNLLKEATMNMAQNHLAKDKSEVVDDKPQIRGGSRFNFIRYSEINTTTNAKPPSGPTSTKLVSLMVNQADNQPGDIQTPLDFSNSNHFEEFVTSTKLRDSNYILEEVNGVRPIETTSKRSSTSAKRNLLKEATMNMAQNHLAKDKSEVVDDKPQIRGGSRFNFIRYNEINTTINGEEEKSEYEKQKLKDKCQEQKPPQQQETPCSPKKGEDITVIAEISLQEEKTPPKKKLADEDTPVNYVSPYVSVSRGKVSLKKEKEKRNSLYSASPLSAIQQLNDSIHSNVIAASQSPQYSTEVRRTLEAVRYYRKQLQEEIDRLHQQCNVWETYKNENIALLQAANVDDMIDVTVGQTRLLTSKKFMQFKGLIDRCEAGATGINHRPYDGSEATKFISSVDLEGFWSMLGLQVDNLQKRFESLNRWKYNNWQDPEEAKPKGTKPKNLSKIKKKTPAPVVNAKPNSALQQLLRKMQAEMRNKRANNMLNTTYEILTPSKVRDRKYFSPAATVVGIPTTANRRLSLLARKNSQDSPNRRMSNGVGRRNSQETSTATAINENTPRTNRASLHEAVMPANAEAEAQSAFSSPKIQSRKSILKTPGSARTNLRNIIFNQKCRVKKFNFVINDNADDPECNDSIEEDIKENAQESDQESESGPTSGCGTYSLRNRKVRLRPSCEIVIPK